MPTLYLSVYIVSLLKVQICLDRYLFIRFYNDLRYDMFEKMENVHVEQVTIKYAYLEKMFYLVIKYLLKFYSVIKTSLGLGILY